MKKRLLAIVPLLATSVCLGYFVYLLDGYVYGTLYNYGLQLGSEWSSGYWMTWRMVEALLSLNIAFSFAGLLYLYRKSVQSQPKMPRVTETPIRSPGTIDILETPVQTRSTVPKKTSSLFQKQKPKPQPQAKVQAKPEEYVSSGLVRCNHCGKEFAQPLRMLDFHEDPPRMINVCPFCSEVMIPNVEDNERNRRAPFREFYLDEKNNSRGT